MGAHTFVDTRTPRTVFYQKKKNTGFLCFFSLEMLFFHHTMSYNAFFKAIFWFWMVSLKSSTNPNKNKQKKGITMHGASPTFPPSSQYCTFLTYGSLHKHFLVEKKWT